LPPASACGHFTRLRRFTPRGAIRLRLHFSRRQTLRWIMFPPPIAFFAIACRSFFSAFHVDSSRREADASLHMLRRYTASIRFRRQATIAAAFASLMLRRASASYSRHAVELSGATPFSLRVVFFAAAATPYHGESHGPQVDRPQTAPEYYATKKPAFRSVRDGE